LSTKRRPIDLDLFPDSPYATELREGVSRLRFAPALEAEFLTAYLTRARLRVRIWGTLGALFALIFTTINVLKHGWTHPISLWHVYVVMPLCLLLGAIPWSRFFVSHYPRVVRWIGPPTCLLTAMFSMQGLTEGRNEILIVAALQMIGIFYFTALRMRLAVITSIATLAGFVIGMALWGLAAPLAVKYGIMLTIAAFVAALAYRETETLQRTQFLERRLLTELLERDPLTGLKNRRVFDDHLQRVWHQAQRDRRSLAVLMVDVDHFKAFNDLYGHQAGDEALRRVGAVLRDYGRRPLDLVARYGGEEFAVILHDVTLDHARDLAESLRRGVEALAIEHRGATTASVVTLSVGAALVEPVIGRTPKGAVQLADEALYEAKRAGRNRVALKDVDSHKALVTGTFSRPRASA
jgi:diguanylate cyclase (GGDEF)-like protein